MRIDSESASRQASKEPEPRGKTRITIRLDEDMVFHFLRQSDVLSGATGYQTLINEALQALEAREGAVPKHACTEKRKL